MSDPIRSISQNNYLLSNGGGGHEYSGANGVYVDNENEVIGLDTSASNAIETVIENSGAWGGAGLPISAGPGIKVGLENGVLMISRDETVLYENSAGTSSTVTLSGNPYDYEALEIYAATKNTGTNIVPGANIHRFSMSNSPTRLCVGSSMVQQSNIAIAPMGFNLSSGSISLPTLSVAAAVTVLFKVVGIGRKSN